MLKLIKFANVFVCSNDGTRDEPRRSEYGASAAIRPSAPTRLPQPATRPCIGTLGHSAHRHPTAHSAQAATQDRETQKGERADARSHY